MLQKLKQKFIFSSPIQNLIPTLGVVFLFSDLNTNPHPYLIYGSMLAVWFGFKSSILSLLFLMFSGGWFQYQSIRDPILTPLWILQNSILPITFFMLPAVIGSIRDGLNQRIKTASDRFDELREIQEKIQNAFQQSRKRNHQLEEELAREFRRTLDALTLSRMATQRDWLKTVGKVVDADSLQLYRFSKDSGFQLVESIGAAPASDTTPSVKSDEVVKCFHLGRAHLSRMNGRTVLYAPVLSASHEWLGLLQVQNPKFLTIHQETFRILEEAARCAEKRL